MDLACHPSGHLHLAEAAPGTEPAAGLVPEPVRAAWLESEAAGLIALARPEGKAAVPPALAWFREFAIAALLTLRRTGAPGTLPPDGWAAWRDRVPPMAGAEYVDEANLERLWRAIQAHAAAGGAAHAGGPDGYFTQFGPGWHGIGRVTFHLGENRQSVTHPFAFLATYASRLASNDRPVYQPLSVALNALQHDSTALNALLEPVRRASEKSPLVREWVETRSLFHPLAWTAEQAARFLREIPLLEDSGVLVRLPDWARHGRAPRATVRVSLGQQAAAGLGMDALLDFRAELTLEGEPLGEEEKRTLLTATQGLVMLKGRWVEVDPEQLRESLLKWTELQDTAYKNGISFREAMRLLSGAAEEREEAGPDEEGDRWTGIEPGVWLGNTLERLRGETSREEFEAGPGFHGSLRPYQHAGARWLWFLRGLGLGACLADDMGLGKTIQVLAVLARLAREGGGPALLVVPASLLGNWKAEAARFAPGLRMRTLHASGDGLDFSDGWQRTADLFVTTYTMVARLEELRRVDWDTVILDEAQAIKNPGARQTRAVKSLPAAARVALTGTPVENRPADLWSIFDFLNPGLLGPLQSFESFARKSAEARASVRKLARPYILRRLKTDKSIIQDLPDKTEVRAFCPLSREQAALYEQSVADLRTALATVDGIQRRGVVLAFMMRLKQVCNHPSHWLGRAEFPSDESGKFQRLAALVEEIAARQEKVLVFTQFREMTGPLENHLRSLFGRPGLVLHGGTPVSARRRLVEQFQAEDGPPFFVLSLKAGGAGLNLTAASHVIHFDRWWNPAVEDQATDRAFRIGQKRNVLVHKFVCMGTLEERIESMLEDKKALAGELLSGDGSETLLTEMSDRELLDFVALDLNRAIED